MVFFAVFAAVLLTVVFLAVDLLAAVFADDAFLPPRVLSASLKALAGVNRTLLDAAIFTGSPVCGLRPMRAARAVGLNVPNPKMLTRLPALASAITASNNAVTAVS